ncbi:GNAT family N-acetyltransferase [Lysobacter gummosus]|uniref:GNAT family N-acetyltransferase n=1 Tax=Lysobacter gummosus TaxID=262324 RepID=A0ABY3X9H9_9GAMM|nr:GNAT family N-acetyltransferase [Lysobacter gummosus]ALN93139.1 acetyltransferase family protein [Lysobacter gummosus]UNP28645.1 GNAT family N-acetyltransferase [Lysobacter gummosus]
MPIPRAIEAADRHAIGRFLTRRWGTATIMLDARAIDAAALPGFIACAAGPDQSGDDDGIAGLATLLDDDIQTEIVTLDAVSPGAGLGTALIELAAQRARALGLQRLLTRTTNDNLDALRFYQRRGFRLYRLTPGAIDREREADPAIARIGRHGIPLRDEITLIRPLDDE